MYGTVKDELAATLREIEEAGLYKRERELSSPQSAHITTARADGVRAGGAQLLRQQLPRPRRPPRRSSTPPEALTTAASACPASASSAARRTSTRSSRHAIRLPRHRGHHPLLVLLRRQRRPVRDAPRRGGRDHLRRAQPRLDHRRRPPLQGQRASATRTTTWPTWSAAQGDAASGCAAHDRHRRRLLDGRRHRRLLDQICDLADKYDAMVMVDDSHATGFMGTPAAAPPSTAASWTASTSSPSTLGKALGGAAAATSAAHREIVDLLRQRSRPYLFSNTVAPAIAGASIAVARSARGSTELRDRLGWPTPSASARG